MTQKAYERMAFTSVLRGRLQSNSAEATTFPAGLMPVGLPFGDSFPGLTGATAMLGTVELPLNPRVVAHEQGKRFGQKNTRDGAVFFHFTNARGQNLDLLTLRFEGTTGNIDPRTVPGLERHKRWLNLYVMSREPVRLADGAENVIQCLYSSRAFPFPLQFSGFFKSVVTFTESGDKPNSLDYSFEFQVTDADQLDDVLNAFDSALVDGVLATATASGGNGQ